MSDTIDIKMEAECIDVARKQIGQRFAKLDAQLTTNNARALLGQVKQTRTAYEPLPLAAMELAIGGQTFEAQAFFAGQGAAGPKNLLWSEAPLSLRVAAIAS